MLFFLILNPFKMIILKSIKITIADENSYLVYLNSTALTLNELLLNKFCKFGLFLEILLKIKLNIIYSTSNKFFLIDYEIYSRKRVKWKR